MAGDTHSTTIDWLVITAGSRAQARGYRAMLRDRAPGLRSQGIRRWLVVPDPMDRRAGSGNATLLSLAKVIEACLSDPKRDSDRPRTIRRALRGQRILIIHCGGDSRRLPAYAAIGKLFLPLDRRTNDGRPTDMFELIVEDLARLLRRSPPTTLVASGDVLLNASTHTIDLSAPGITGVAFPADTEVASRHGVYVTDSRSRVLRFLQKPSRDELARAHALTSDGRANVDSGIVAICHNSSERLLRAFGFTVKAGKPHTGGDLAGARRALAPPMDLYEHVLMAAAGARSGPRALQSALDRTPFHCRIIPTCDFLHIGTTEQLLDIATADTRVRDNVDATPMVTMASTGLQHLSSSGRAWVDGCRFGARTVLRGDNVLVGVRTITPLEMPNGWGVVIVPLGPRRFVAVAFGLSDDFKTSVEHGATIGGQPLAPLVDVLGHDAVWPASRSKPGVTRTLFNARLWPVASSRAEAMAIIRWMWSDVAAPSRAWRSKPRVSLAEAILACDRDVLLMHRNALALRYAREQTGKCLRDALLAKRPSLRASHFWMASEHARSAGRDPLPLQDCAFRTVAAAVARSARRTSAPALSAGRDAIQINQEARTSFPARIDLAGGWSDTPPICHDLGGTVVNVAVRVNASHALRAIVRRTASPGIRITSTDLGRTMRVRSAADLSPPFDPTRWHALAFAAIALSVPPGRQTRTVDALTERFWSGPGGIDISTSSMLPKGSGLGTSSILAATLLAALADARGDHSTSDILFSRTLALEQSLGTGGGWQDQVGGLTPGFKILRTRPGESQVPVYLPLPEFPLDDPDGPRPLLYFTGVRRMARGILRGVVGSYLARRSSTLRIIDELKAGAEAMAAGLATGDRAVFIERLNEYWKLKRAIDPGASLASVESLVERHARDILAWELPGAGGGGYLFLLAKDSRAAARIRRSLTNRPLGPGAHFADVAVDHNGIRFDRT